MAAGASPQILPNLKVSFQEQVGAAPHVHAAIGSDHDISDLDLKQSRKEKSGEADDSDSLSSSFRPADHDEL
jgi:hypothetical protein